MAVRRPPMRLSSGNESRTEGAPATALPGYADAVDAVAMRMLEDAHLAVTPASLAAIRPQAEAYVQDNVRQKRSGRNIPPAEQAQYKASDERMQDFASNYYQATGAPDWATNEMVESLGGEPVIQLDPRFADSDGVYRGGFSGPVLTEQEQREKMELDAWRKATKEERERETARYGVGNDAQLQEQADAPLPTDDIPTSEVVDFLQLGPRQSRGPGRWVTPAPPRGRNGMPAVGMSNPARPLEEWPAFPVWVPPRVDDPPGSAAGDRIRALRDARITDAPIAPGLMPAIEDRQAAEGQIAERTARRGREDRFHSSDPQRESRIERMAISAGIPYAEAAALVDRERTTVRPPTTTTQEAGAAAAGMIPPIGAPPMATGANPLDEAGVPLTQAERRAEFAPLRNAVRGARVDNLLQRRARVAQNADLAGGQPTGGPGGTRALVAGMNQGWARTDDLIARLGQEGLSDWERAAIMQQLSPRAEMSNPTPLAVDAQGIAAAMRNMNAAAFSGQDQIRQQMADQQLENQMREQAPAVQAQRDIAAGNTQTAEAVTHLDELAARTDTTYVGFSYEDEARLADILSDPNGPYKMPREDAEALAYRLAEKRRWTSGTAPGGRAAGAPPAQEAPLPPNAAQAPPIVPAPQGGGRGRPPAAPLNIPPRSGGGRGSGARPPRR